MITDIDPAFRTHLEWEITRALRREASLGVQRHRRMKRRIRNVTLTGACLALGIAGNFASAQVRNSSRRDSLLQAAQVEQHLVELRRQLAQAEADRAQQQWRAGIVSSSTAAAANAELRMVEAHLARMALDAEEIRLGSDTPRNDLTAPLVQGRDFVRQRLQLELSTLQQQLAQAQSNLADVDRQVRVGAMSTLARSEADVEVARARGELRMAAEKASLRDDFLQHNTDALALASRLEAVQRQIDIELATQTLALARERVVLVQRQREAGAAADVELMRAQLDAKERELELVHLRAQAERGGRP